MSARDEVLFVEQTCSTRKLSRSARERRAAKVATVAGLGATDQSADMMFADQLFGFPGTFQMNCDCQLNLL